MSKPQILSHTVASSPRFLRDRRGNVAMMFGMLLLPLVGCVGLAIDFGNVMSARTKAQMAADAAALQATGVTRDLIKDSDGSDASTASAITEGKKRADKLFSAHAKQSGLNSYSIDTVVRRTGQTITASANFRVTTPTYFAKAFGPTTLNAAGTAVSSSSLPNYSDVYLALDVSGSMGIAATQAEMVRLFYARGRRADGTTQQASCVFGCHTVEADKGWAESFSTLASRLGVRLRIDVLRDAVIDMINTAADDADSAPIYRIGLFTMGASADASTWSLNQLYPLSNNFTGLKAAAATIDIATPPLTAPQKQNTYINEQLAFAAPTLPASYDGSSQARSKKYVFIMTDGARDVPSTFGNCITPGGGSGRCVNGIDPANCKTLKDKGITVGVMYTTYVPILIDPANSGSGLEYWYNLEMVNTGAAAKIQPALKACASDGWFFEASDADGITAAMAKMFAQTTQAPTLTN